MTEINKKELRKELLRRRNAMLQQERKEKSARIANKVMALDMFKKSNKVLLYEAIRSEVETELIYREAKKQKKAIYYPRVIGDKMEFYLVDESTEFDISNFGIREPRPETTKAYEPNSKDAVFMLMPGAVFDKAGNRIGYGGGYYDKYIHWLYHHIAEDNVAKVAVAFECQLVDIGVIECESHDIKVNYIITESQQIKVQSE